MRWLPFGLLLLLLCWVMTLSFSGGVEEFNEHVVVIDAGSSGSRVYVHKLRCGGGDPGLHSTTQLKIEPGLSSYAGRPQEALRSLLPLLRHAEEVVPAATRPRTRLMVMATAGLRLLRPEDSDEILDELRRGLPEHSTFAVDPANIRIITGEEEGLFGWIAVNYLLGRLRNPGGRGRKALTVGCLDMGGGSSQIAFEVPPNDVPGLDPASVTQIRLSGPFGGRSYRLHVSTRLGFGANYARKRYVAGLAERHPAGASADDPCLHPGMVDAWGGDKLGKPRGGARLELHGAGDFERCRAAVQPLLREPGRDCQGAPCTMEGTPPFPYGMEVLGFSEFWYTMEDVFGIGGRYNHTDFDARSRRWCGREWGGLEAEYAAGKYPGAKPDRFKHQCFKAAWMSAMLHQGYRVKPGSPFQSASKIAGTSAEWTLGAVAALSELCTAPPVNEHSGESLAWHLCGSVALWVMVAAVLLWLVYFRAMSAGSSGATPGHIKGKMGRGLGRGRAAFDDAAGKSKQPFMLV